jgi:hypothetical protein
MGEATSPAEAQRAKAEAIPICFVHESDGFHEVFNQSYEFFITALESFSNVNGNNFGE